MVARPLGSLSGLGCIVIAEESQGHFRVLKEESHDLSYILKGSLLLLC